MARSELAGLFGGAATWERIQWGGSGRWRAIVTISGGARAAFEFDVDDRLLGYGLVPAKADGGGEEVAITWLEG